MNKRAYISPLLSVALLGITACTKATEEVPYMDSVTRVLSRPVEDLNPQLILEMLKSRDAQKDAEAAYRNHDFRLIGFQSDMGSDAPGVPAHTPVNRTRLKIIMYPNTEEGSMIARKYALFYNSRILSLITGYEQK